jgi:AraC-like DNA-binding protein
MDQLKGFSLFIDFMEVRYYSIHSYQLDYSWSIKSRRLNHTILWYVSKGSFFYSLDGEPFRSDGETIALLPADTTLTSHAISDEIELISINFDISIPFLISKKWSDLIHIPVQQRTQHMGEIRSMLLNMLEAEASLSVAKSMILQGNLMLLLGELFEQSLQGRALSQSPLYTDQRIDALTEYLFLQETRIPPIRDLCDLVHLSESQLRKLFNKHTGLSPLQYIRHVKIEQSKRLLVHRNEHITEISRHLGFQDANYFSRIFKKNTGYTPQEYREKFYGI